MSAEYAFLENTTDTPLETYWSNPEWERNSATLHKLDATYYLQLISRKSLRRTYQQSRTERSSASISTLTDT